MSERKPRLFYFEQAVSGWVQASIYVENIIDVSLLDDGEVQKIAFKRIDMTDEELNALPEE